MKGSLVQFVCPFHRDLQSSPVLQLCAGPAEVQSLVWAVRNLWVAFAKTGISGSQEWRFRLISAMNNVYIYTCTLLGPSWSQKCGKKAQQKILREQIRVFKRSFFVWVKLDRPFSLKA